MGETVLRDGSIATGGRINLVDQLRGAALFGILLANMMIFQYGMYGQSKLELFDASIWDLRLAQMLEIMVIHSFMPIFGVLFGFGLWKMVERQQASGRKSRWMLVRRFILLGAVGLLHSTLLWDGDILLAYGMVGFLLLLFLKRKPKTLVIWVIVLTTLYSIAHALPEDLGSSSSTGSSHSSKMEAYVKETRTLYAEGSYSEIYRHRMEEDPLDSSLGMKLVSVLLAPLVASPPFLIGIAAAKLKWFHRPLGERGLYRRRALWMLPLGIILKSVYVLGFGKPWTGFLLSVGSLLLALGYLFLMAWVLSGWMQKGWLARGFESVGRLSMTNYLMQTVICTSLFYGYGFGWFGKLGVAVGCLIAVGVYGVQLAGSTGYLRLFRVGPMEQLLRMGTYWSWTGRPGSARKDEAEGNHSHRAGA